MLTDRYAEANRRLSGLCERVYELLVQYSKDTHVCIGDASGFLVKKLNQWFSTTVSLKAEHKIYHNVN
jgi:hypothetical protein